jgi:ATP-binding cassette subfamily B (MDR/TAP) protein 1
MFVVNCIVTLYGTSLLYKEVRRNGCDPSTGAKLNESCSESGPDVFGAFLGVVFAVQGITQFGDILEAISAARAAASEALQVMNRRVGAPKEIIYGEDESGAIQNTDVEASEKKVKAILPKYEIDSSSASGLKPNDIKGGISFKNVDFSYPTRPNVLVLNGLTVDIEAGRTFAIVGPSGGGR